MTSVKIDCQNLRLERQRENNQIMFHALITQDKDLVKYHCNNNELERVLAELNEVFRYNGQLLTLEHLLLKCNADHMYAMTLAGRISKVASRQGTKDEAYILDKCNQTVSQIGVEIKNLTTTEFRPTKDGRILTNEKYKRSGLNKSDCLKSFDAQISGKVNGWVFAKVAFGKGGHQDNVFIEAHEFGNWVRKYGKKDELYVMLIDTDLTSQVQELQQKFAQPNILVCDHFEFQQILLTRFGAQN
jgi:hypothetical protein